MLKRTLRNRRDLIIRLNPQNSGLWVQNEQNVTDIRKWLYEPNFRDMQPSTPIFAVVSHPKVVTEPVATLLIVFYYPTNARFNFPTSLAIQACSTAV